jgi:hypothetical protein
MPVKPLETPVPTLALPVADGNPEGAYFLAGLLLTTPGINVAFSGLMAQYQWGQGNRFQAGVWAVGGALGVYGAAGLYQGAFKGALSSTFLDADLIRFSQRSVGRDWSEIAASMRESGWQGSAVDVVQMPDGLLTSVDNTRLLAARMTGTDVLANIRNFSDPIGDMAGRFSNRFGVPETWGDAVSFRIMNQGAIFRDAYPMGSPFTGVPIPNLR